MGTGTLEGRVIGLRGETAADFRSFPGPPEGGIAIAGTLTSAFEPPTPWTGVIPGDALEQIRVRPTAEGLVLTGPREDQSSRYQVRDYEVQERKEGLLYRGKLSPPRGHRLDFEVFTDPEPVTLVVAAVLAAGCLLDWMRKRGRANCLEQYADLARDCIRRGGSPEIQVRTVLGVSVSRGLSVGCHLTCDFVCRQA